VKLPINLNGWNLKSAHYVRLGMDCRVTIWTFDSKSSFHHSIESFHPIVMIIRSCLRYSKSSIRPLSRWRAHQGRPLRKYTTSSASASAPSSPPSSFSVLSSVTSELDKLSPRFEVQPSQIQILKSPGEFYEALKVRLRSSLCRAIILPMLLS
jgi:hypothetical protein